MRSITNFPKCLRRRKRWRGNWCDSATFCSASQRISSGMTTMRITDDECDVFRQLYLQNEGNPLTTDEAREMLSRLSFLFDRFAAWLAKEKAAGRVSER